MERQRGVTLPELVFAMAIVAGFVITGALLVAIFN